MFYAGKVELIDGSMLHPITVYAASDEAALEAIEGTYRDETVARVHVALIDPVHEKGFGRHPDDRLGVVEHVSFTWSDPGPIHTVSLFGR